MLKTKINLIKNHHEQKRKTHKKHILKSAVCGAIALTVITASILAIAQEQKRDYYITQATLTAVSNEGLLFVTPDGNLWSYSGQYHEEMNGDITYTILFDGNGTGTVKDDVIIRFWKTEATETESEVCNNGLY